MFWLKHCPRCGGDLHDASDWYGTFITCLQCGLNKDVTGEQLDPRALNFDVVPRPVIPKFQSGKQRRLSHGGRHTSKTFVP